MAHEWATKISRVMDGKVIIHGYSHEGLIGDYTYADGVYLTIRGELPTKQESKMMDAMLNSLLDHGFVAASVLAAIEAGSVRLPPQISISRRLIERW